MSTPPEFRILVTGSRSWDNAVTIREALQPYRTRGAVLVHGDAPGADRLAAKIWTTWGGQVEAHPANWDAHGKAAGYRRNEQMVRFGADICLAFIRDHSPGATHTVNLSTAAGIRTVSHDYTPPVRPTTPHSAAGRTETAAPQQNSWKIITTALDQKMGPGRGSGNPLKWTNYLCPVHEADGNHHTPSLGIRYDPEQAKTIVRCWATCDDVKVLAALRHPTEERQLEVRDMFDRLPPRNQPQQQQATRRPEQHRQDDKAPTPVEQAIAAARFPILSKPDLGVRTGPGETVDTYVYCWPDGRPEGAVARVETPHEHGHAKSFWQARWNGTDWEKGRFAPIPWQLDRIQEAREHGHDIFICEGEKDVQAAERAGLTATCNAMGAGSWTQEHAKWLRGASRVVVVADRDRPGYRHAAKVADTLHRTVGDIRIVQARDGKDLTDHFAAGHLIEDLEPVPYLDHHYHSQHQRFQRSSGRTRSR
ncbi:SLOG family protein [Nocardia sp. XZ_19_385]|uniref:SLOG family protein n=1 Tax=Nocardia sp. XZ_19_385 TaxID=2769488 RepID=UPI00188F6712|nr:SLOG family protein [Nocardia sp. XZ_19_385]